MTEPTKQRVTAIYDYAERTQQPLFYVVEGASKSVPTDRFLVYAVLTNRQDVERFELDDPDVFPGSLVAQQCTRDALHRLLIEEAFSVVPRQQLRDLIVAMAPSPSDEMIITTKGGAR